MTDDELKESIKTEEGLSLEAYKDSRGYLTVGYGHLLAEGSTIPREAAEIIFDADFEQAATDYLKLGLDLDPIRRAALIDMIFNMGLPRVRRFVHFLAYLREKNWIKAAIELMDSDYARQLPERAKRNRKRILGWGGVNENMLDNCQLVFGLVD